MRFLFVVLSVVFVISCQQKQTKIVSQETVQGGDQNSLERFRKENPAVLDVRSPFDFNLMHMPGAINVRWEDFSQTDAHVRGLLQSDLFAVARRLSLIGIDPERKVLVVGKGIRGNGEEGRVAWTLKVLGVKNVMTLNHDHFREANPRESNPPVENKPYWKPQVDETLTVDAKEFRTLVRDTKSPVVVLDVRSQAEFQQDNLKKSKKVTAQVVSVEWKNFYTDKGAVRSDLETLLQSHNITKDQTILLVSNHGVRSAAVTFALREAGFKNSRNFAGGLEQWRTVR